jgi:predicted Rossmann fold flavoprotein
MYDLIVVGSGPSGLIASILASRRGKKVLILEKLAKPSLKLKATGGGRCNLSNTLSNDEFIKSFGKNGRFMRDAIYSFDNSRLFDFFDSIGVDLAISDGFRVFPKGHNSQTILDGFFCELDRLNIELKLSCEVYKIIVEDNLVVGVGSRLGEFRAKNILIATGGCGYSTLGGSEKSFDILRDIGHTITKLYPAMIPLKVKESWIANCKADTVSKTTIKIDIKKYSKSKACGDLIFTNSGIRGPVVLDFAREITPLFDKYDEVPILVSLTKGKNESEILESLKRDISKNMLDILCDLLPKSIVIEILKLCSIDATQKFTKISGVSKDMLIKYLAWTPLTVTGCDGFDRAMVTRGGASLKEINPKTMQSRLYQNLYFAGEVVDLDGPCGGYNLRWAFASGSLVGLM